MSGQQAAPVFLAAGGTGGHIFPALAVAEHLLAQGVSVALLTDRRFREEYRRSMPAALQALPIYPVHAAPLSGGLAHKILALVNNLRGLFDALRLIRELRPRCVVGFGGYPSLPPLLAAILLRTPTMLQEQNAVLGRVNRLLARHVTRLALSTPDTRLVPPGIAARCVVAGTPVRRAIAGMARPYHAPEAGEKLNLLVIGGSLGASVFAQVIPAAMALLSEDLRHRITLTLQCRSADLPATQQALSALAMPAELSPFFTDIETRLARAHLVIARAGASSVAELTLLGIPTLYVPLPIATDDHQFHNARAVADAGGGWVVRQQDCTPQYVAQWLREILGNPGALSAIAKASAGLGVTDAAVRIADALPG